MWNDSFAYFNHPQIKPGNGLQFEVGQWLSPYASRIVIPNPQPLPSSLSRLNLPYAITPSEVLSHEAYLAAVEEIIHSCRERNGKTVFSRIITGNNPELNPVEAASALFTSFPDSFGFLFASSETGCWIGATPETLLDFDYNSRRVTTMAYAGTRTDRGEAPWDSKNLRENKFVADHIISVFEEFDINPMVSEAYTSSYGQIQHLRRDISATLPSDVKFWQLLDALNPTPALCGTPTRDAVDDINHYEPSPRGCYGGFIALHRPGDFFHARVCLRCAELFSDGRFEIHSGGGITPDSIPEAEFCETEAKAAVLLSILSQKHGR